MFPIFNNITSVVCCIKLKLLEAIVVKFCIQIVFVLIASSVATHAVSQDLSGWSDKTLCRLALSQQGDLQYLQEAKKRGLSCGNELARIPSLTTKINSSSTDHGLKVLDEHKFECMNETFDKFINVFGVYVAGTNKAAIEKVIHTAGILAQYLDNDEDGLPDDAKISSYLSEHNFIVPVWSKEEREGFTQNSHGTLCEDNIRLQASMYYTEDRWAIGGIQKTGQWDTNLEEVWHIVSAAWYEVYSDYFGDNNSLLLRAMNKARGDVFKTIPSTYPKNAWYTYYDETCDYSCQSHEYFYWILMANMSALDPSLTDKCERSSREWNICNQSELRQQDALAYELLNEYDLVLPTQIPNGQYRPSAAISSVDSSIGTEPDSSKPAVLNANFTNDLIIYDLNSNKGSPLCADPNGYCASWNEDASKECKENYRLGDDARSLKSRLVYEHCIFGISFEPFISMPLKRSSNLSPSYRERENAKRLIRYGWDKKTSIAPKIIAATDVPTVIEQAAMEGLEASIDRLGNYGPLRIYIVGNDVSVIEPMIRDFCKWSKSPSDNYENCSKDQGEGMREMAYIFPGGNGFADHGWYLEKPVQTLVLNPASGEKNEFLALTDKVELDVDKVATAHEYFHVYQASHTIFRSGNDSGYSMPRWMEESNAVYFSWVIGNENQWININENIEEVIRSVSEFRSRVPGMSIVDIEQKSGTQRVRGYCGELCIGALQYDYAVIATILLTKKTADDTLFVDFYQNHKKLGWIAAFEKTFDIPVDDFYRQLEDFLSQPIPIQIKQLTENESPQNNVKNSQINIHPAESISVVGYNTKLTEICQNFISLNWDDYLDINKKEFNSNGYMFAVVGKDNRCEYGIGPSKKDAFNDCMKWKQEQDIVGACEFYAKGKEVVWDGHLKLSKSGPKKALLLKATGPVDYIKKLKQIKSLLDEGIINEEDFEQMKQNIIDAMD